MSEKNKSCFTIIALIEFLKYQFYPAHEKGAATLKFSTERFFKKIHAWESLFLVKKFQAAFLDLY